MAESEQQQNSAAAVAQPHQPSLDTDGLETMHHPSWEDPNSYIMRDWLLVAAGLERLFFSIYALAFAVITSVYV